MATIKVKHNGQWVKVPAIVALKEGDQLQQVSAKLDEINGVSVGINCIDKAKKVEQTKTEIAAAISAKGVPTSASEVFDGFPSKIAAIEQGSTTPINNQSKSVNVVKNGTQTITADDGYTGLGSVTIKTNVPSTPAVPKTEVKTVSITSNGQTIVEKSPSVDGMTRVTVNVDVPTSGGGASSSDLDFSKIGYTETPKCLIDGLAYAELIKNSWDENAVLKSKFEGDKKILFCPSLSSNAVDTDDFVARCTSLLVVGDLNFSKAYRTMGMFEGCTNLIQTGRLNFDTSIYFARLFSTCYSLEKITELSTNSLKNITTSFTGCTSLRYCLFKGIGSQQEGTVGVFTDCHKYGINNEQYPDAKQSLIDTLLTYSFDRKSAGYPDFTFHLSKETLAVLTEEERSQITAKGYILTDQPRVG